MNEYLKEIEKLNLENIELAERIKENKHSRLYKIVQKFLYEYIFHIMDFDDIKENDFNLCSVDNNKKIVVYTCITGNYDKVQEPLFEFKNIDYVLFTNNSNLVSQKWKIIYIDNKLVQNNNINTNRYIKFHPFELFKNKYDYAIYIDGNVKVISNLSNLILSTKNKTGLSMHRHYMRNSIYSEGNACIFRNKGNKKYIKEYLKKCKKIGFPEHYGLLECSIIVTDLKNENAKIIYDNFWNEFIASKTMRDQLIFPYILWKMNYKIDDVGSLGNNEYRDPKFKFIKHND